jgi:hypothetical protein
MMLSGKLTVVEITEKHEASKANASQQLVLKVYGFKLFRRL